MDEIIKSIITESPEATEQEGGALAQKILECDSIPRFVALRGDLGVGKTAFVRGFTAKIAPTAKVKSPTFALVNEYRGGARTIFHFDMYRIEDEDDLYSIGFYDYLDRDGICLVEWSENIPYALPEEYLKVEIKKIDREREECREIEISLCRQ